MGATLMYGSIILAGILGYINSHILALIIPCLLSTFGYFLYRKDQISALVNIGAYTYSIKNFLTTLLLQSILPTIIFTFSLWFL